MTSFYHSPIHFTHFLLYTKYSMHSIGYLTINPMLPSLIQWACPLIMPLKKKTLQHRFLFQWNKDSLQYLGIKWTPSTCNLFKINFLPLLTTIQQEMTRLRKFFLSWSGRLTAYTSILLPKILYYFRTLLIHVSNTFLSTLAYNHNWLNLYGQTIKLIVYSRYWWNIDQKEVWAFLT